MVTHMKVSHDRDKPIDKLLLLPATFPPELSLSPELYIVFYANIMLSALHLYEATRIRHMA